MHAKNVNEICYICFNFPLKEIYISFKTAIINMLWNINSEIENFAIQSGLTKSKSSSNFRRKIY